MLGTRLFSIGCKKWQHAVILKLIWERDSHYFLSRLTDGSLHSSSDLLYFTLLLLFTWTNYFKSSSPSPFRLFGQKFSKSNFSSLFSSDKNILSPTSMPQKDSKTIPNSVSAAKSVQSRKNILSPIFFLT